LLFRERVGGIWLASPIQVYLDLLRGEGRAVDTVNSVENMLGVPFEAARRQGLIPLNPASAVDSLKDAASSSQAGREPFTAKELVRLIETAQGDWRGAVLLGATSGLRLSDVANLCWESVDLVAGLLNIETQKTGRLVVVPMHPGFASWLAERPRGIGKAPVFPALAGKRTDGALGLSVAFRHTLPAGMGRVVTRERQGAHHQQQDIPRAAAWVHFATGKRWRRPGHSPKAGWSRQRRGAWDLYAP
jgi:integrase